MLTAPPTTTDAPAVLPPAPVDRDSLREWLAGLVPVAFPADSTRLIVEARSVDLWWSWETDPGRLLGPRIAPDEARQVSTAYAARVVGFAVQAALVVQFQPDPKPMAVEDMEPEFQAPAQSWLADGRRVYLDEIWALSKRPGPPSTALWEWSLGERRGPAGDGPQAEKAHARHQADLLPDALMTASAMHAVLAHHLDQFPPNPSPATRTPRWR